ncbi:MAG: hypothetical protein IPP59_09345 [Betaproteobacteria bacterium]|nr:hypothetical protein [Candidatus Dechloromonas phosphorivorans]
MAPFAGVFGAGERGTPTTRKVSPSLADGAGETQLKLFGGLNSGFPDLWLEPSGAGDFDGAPPATHTASVLRVDQRLGDGVNVFARYGKMLKGGAIFNQIARHWVPEFNGGYSPVRARRRASGLAVAGCNQAKRSGRTRTAYLDGSQLTSSPTRRAAAVRQVTICTATASRRSCGR